MYAIGLAISNALLPDLSSRPDSVCKLLQDLNGCVPVDASICDAHAPLQAGRTLCWHFLRALVEVRFDHHADDGLLTFAKLVADGLGHLWLVLVVLLGVA